MSLRSSCLWVVLCAGVSLADGLPATGQVELRLEDASWKPGEAGPAGPLTVVLDRFGGAWCPAATVTGPGQGGATHSAILVSANQTQEGIELLIRARLRPDPWDAIWGEGAWRVRFRIGDDGACAGQWRGVLHGREGKGAVGGAARALPPVAGFTAPKRGEHPRLLIRRDEIPALRRKAATEWGQRLLARLRADTASPVAQAMAYVLTGEKAHAEAARQLIAAAIDRDLWYHTGIAHAPAFVAVEHLIAYDLIHDACDAAFHRRMRDFLSDKMEFFYWGVHNGQFNNRATSNWSLMYRSGLGLIALSLLDAEGLPAPAAPATTIPRIEPPKDLTAGEEVPVVRLVDGKPIGDWLYAGPVDEPLDADAFASAGGAASARPQTGTRAGTAAFARLGPPHLADGVVDLAALTKRAYRQASYLYCVLEVDEAGVFLWDEPYRHKGLRHQTAWIAGRRLAPRDAVELAKGRYPLLVRVWAEPVGNWEPLQWSLTLARQTPAQVQAWRSQRDGDGKAGAFCGPAWREAAARQTPWNLEPLRWAMVACREAEGYFLNGLGDHGWNQEGEAYTRHATRLAMPLALCVRNTFGRDIPGAERLGMMMALAAAATVYSDDGARMQSFNVGGGPMDVDLFARAFGFVPDPQRPAVLWAWNRSLALAEAGKLKDPHGVISRHDGLSTAMLLLNYPLEMAEKNPREVLPRVTVDRQKGGVVFRNDWAGRDDIVVSVFANSNPPGGSWSSAQGGTFRITGLGHDWVVRGQGYGNGGSGRGLPDFSLYQNMVDVKEQFLDFSPEATIAALHKQDDGSGRLSLTMDGIYIHRVKEKVEFGTEQRRRVRWEARGLQDLGIRATRSMAVDYSGRSGAAAVIAIGDRLTGTQGANTWQLTTEAAHEVAVDGNRFTITAADGASLAGTVVRPAGAKVRVEASQHVHEINYHGAHRRSRFDRKSVLVKGVDKDQEFLVVLTLQKARVPAVAVDAAGATRVGPLRIVFDGKAVAIDAPQD